MDVVPKCSDLSKRQQCACLIQEIGSRIATTQLVVTTAVYYMHHFYEAFSSNTVKPTLVAITALYLASKAEDNSRKLYSLVQVAYDVFKKTVPPESSSAYRSLAYTIRSLESTMLMVVGFERADVKSPHVTLIGVLRNGELPSLLVHLSYFVCTNIVQLTTLILRHSSDAIAAASLYLAAKWSNYNIKCQNQEWLRLFSPKITMEEIHKIVDEYTLIYQACDAKIKEIFQRNFKNIRPWTVERTTEAVKDVRISEKRQVDPPSRDEAGSKWRSKVPRVASPKSQPPPNNRTVLPLGESTTASFADKRRSQEVKNRSLSAKNDLSSLF